MIRSMAAVKGCCQGVWPRGQRLRRSGPLDAPVLNRVHETIYLPKINSQLKKLNSNAYTSNTVTQIRQCITYL